MATDFTKIQRVSGASSNKVLLEDTGSMTTGSLPGPGENITVATIPHRYGSDELLYQVSANGFGATAVLPWGSNDNRIRIYAYVDDTNLYVACLLSSSGGAIGPYTINYTYRVLVP